MGARPSHYLFCQPGPLRLYSTTELLKMPPPEWLVDQIIPEGALAGCYGAPETGKSFLSIDLALSVASGLPWQGHPTQQGFVLYISAEGGSGISKRVLAWLTEHGKKPTEVDIAWLVESIPVNADSEQMTILVNRLIDEVQRRPVLVVIDTLARCFDGNENEQEDMGRFIAGVDLLRQEFGCAVLVVHHTNAGGTRERGNTAFRGAVDTMIRVQQKDGVIEVACDKQKDAAHFEDHLFELSVVVAADSCVVRPSGSTEDASADLVLHVLGDGLTWTDWRDRCRDDNDNTLAFERIFGKLRYHKRIKKQGDLWVKA